MKITCEHCGSLINTSKDSKCPNCGAPFKDNKEYKKNKDYDQKERELDIKSKELSNKVIEDVIGTKKKFSIVFVVIFVFVIMVFLLIFNSFRSSINESNIIDDNFNKEIDNFMNNTEKEEDIVVNFNEMAEAKNYEIKCDKVTSYEYDVFETEKYRGKNINYYNFHIVFRSKKEGFNALDSISLTYTDEDGNPNVSAKRHTANIKESNFEIDNFVKDTLAHEGNVTFEIPKYVKDVKIIYKNTIINIEDFKGKMK